MPKSHPNSMRLIRLLFISSCLTLVTTISARAEIRTLPPMFNDKLAQESETKQLIDNADLAIKTFRLTKPDQNNALFYIEALIRHSPQNKQIKSLLIDVIKTYTKLANKKKARQQNEAALILYNKAQKIANKYNLSSEVNKLFTLIQAIRKKILTSKQVAKMKKESSQLSTKTKTDSTDLKKKLQATPNSSENIPTNAFSGKPEMVAIPVQKGYFKIGTPILEPQHESNEKQHIIPIPDPYALSRYEVTIGEFRKFVLATNYTSKKSQSTWNDPGYKQSDTNPVVNVSWNDAIAYINWLNIKYPSQNYRLPTEAEWEFAARSNTETIRYWGNSFDEACRYANVYDQTLSKIKTSSQSIQCNDQYAYTAPVNAKQFTPNAFGLYHILGNVREWTCSSYTPLYQGQEQKCTKPTSTSLRVLRGGSWADKARRIRSGDRAVDSPDTFNNKTGFRLATTL